MFWHTPVYHTCELPSSSVRNKEGVVLDTGRGREFLFYSTKCLCRPWDCSFRIMYSWSRKSIRSASSMTSHILNKISDELKFSKGRRLVTKFMSSWAFTPLFKNIKDSALAKESVWIPNPSQDTSMETQKGFALVLLHKYCATKRIHSLQYINLFIRDSGDLLSWGYWELRPYR